MAHAAAAHTEHGHDDHAHDHHEPGFWRKWVFSTDHKMIGIQYIVVPVGDTGHPGELVALRLKQE